MKKYSLKYALDAIDKGFKVEVFICDYSYTSIYPSEKTLTSYEEVFDFLHSYDGKHAHKLYFKILPKLEKQKIYYYIYKNIHGLQITLNKYPLYNFPFTTEFKDKFPEELRVRKELIGAVTQYPELIEEREVEVHYDPKTFGDEQ